MTKFVRLNENQRIIEVDSQEAQRMVRERTAGVTATVGIVEFLRDWTHPTTGRKYQAGDLEKFTDDPRDREIADQLKADNTVRLLVR